MFREILPNLVAPIIVYSTLVIPANILLEAALSFLGVGRPAAARRRWGEMLAKATSIFDTAWWFLLFPGHRAAAHRARVQPGRRRHAGRPQPEGHAFHVIPPGLSVTTRSSTPMKGRSMRRSPKWTLFLGALLVLALRSRRLWR